MSINLEFQERIAATAEVWAKLRIPYIHRGVSKQGCDCSGLMVGILRDQGFLRDFVMPAYPVDWLLHGANTNHLTRLLPQFANQVALEEIIRGDVLLFRFAKQISHAAISIGGDEIVHSVMGRGVKKDKISGAVGWGRRLAQVWRFDPERLGVLSL